MNKYPKVPKTVESTETDSIYIFPKIKSEVNLPSSNGRHSTRLTSIFDKYQGSNLYKSQNNITPYLNQSKQNYR